LTLAIAKASALRATAYEFSDKDVRAELLPHLIGRVFHVTQQHSLDGIRSVGYIDPNVGGALGNSFSQSSKSFGRANGCVCLFDFREKTNEAISWGLDCCNFLESRDFANQIAVLRIDPVAFPQLIPAGSAYERGGAGTIWVPEVECWFSGQLPISLISDILLVTIHRTPIPPNSVIAAIFDANSGATGEGDG
jgi:hypothetical protein